MKRRLYMERSFAIGANEKGFEPSATLALPTTRLNCVASPI